MQTRVRWLVASFVALGFAAFAYQAWLGNVVAYDDAYISYRYADNLVAGHGLVYNVGERVQGYTNFLWTLFAAGGIALGIDPLQTTRVLGVASHLLQVLLISGFALSLWLRRGGPWALCLAPLLAVLVLPEGYAAVAGSGLESSFVGLMLTSIGLVLYAGDLSRLSTRIALAVLLIMASLTRLDCVLAGAALAIAALWASSSFGRDARATFIDVLKVGVPVFVVVAAFLAWSHTFYGGILPNTYYAKAADIPHLREGYQYLLSFGRSFGQALPLFLLVCVGAFARSDERCKRLGLYALFMLCADLLHIVRVGGDFMEYRFMWQIYGLLVLGAAAGLSVLVERSRTSALVVAVTILSVSFHPVELEKRFGMQSLSEMNNYANLGTGLGKRLGQVLPKDTVIATTLAGTMAYFGKRTVIDQWGLNDSYVAHQPYKHNTLPRGHVKFAEEAYQRKRGVNLYIAHPVVCSCSRPCKEDKPNVFIRLGDGRCLRSWYLVQRPELTDYFCAHPEHFVLNRVSCKKPRKPEDGAVGTAGEPHAEPDKEARSSRTNEKRRADQDRKKAPDIAE